MHPSLDYDTLVEGRGIIIDDSTGVVERFANYKAAIGDITQIETDEGEKLPFQVMANPTERSTPNSCCLEIKFVISVLTRLTSAKMPIKMTRRQGDGLSDRCGNGKKMECIKPYDCLLL